MVIKQHKPLAVCAVVLLGVVSLSGCATKKFVRQEVGVVNTKLTGTQEQVTAAQGQIAQHDTQLAQLDRTTKEALERAVAAGKLAEGKFLYETVLTDEKVKFGFDTSDLSPEAQSALDEFAGQLKGENKNVYVEIQGHTDATGSKDGNYRLGAERAEAVRRYLNTQGVPLNRIGTISYGADAPVEPNNTRAGRQANRRVVLIVLT